METSSKACLFTFAIETETGTKPTANMVGCTLPPHLTFGYLGAGLASVPLCPSTAIPLKQSQLCPHFPAIPGSTCLMFKSLCFKGNIAEGSLDLMDR